MYACSNDIADKVISWPQLPDIKPFGCTCLFAILNTIMCQLITCCVQQCRTLLKNQVKGDLSWFLVFHQREESAKSGMIYSPG